ncbi:MAG: acyloxyacyl hydrolase [Bacteroidales bacterium]
MIKKNKFICIFVLILFYSFQHLYAQDSRVQYPSFLSKAYFGVNIGYINYPFSNAHLETGYTAQEVKVPHIAARITLLGYRFNDYLSAQITYMRPVEWVTYKNVSGDPTENKHSVFMNVGGLSLTYSQPLSRKFSLFAEAGLGLITRQGFNDGNNPLKVVVKNSNYASFLLGGGIKYHCNDKWDLLFATVYSPANNTEKQPYTIFHSMGFTYNMHPLSIERINEKNKSAYFFPHRLLQIGYSSNIFNYGVNDVFTNGPIPVFWAGLVYVKKGLSVTYLQNIYHTKKVFSIDWGGSAAVWQSNENKETFCTMSLFPLFRFTFLRSKFADFYFNYSFAGPTYISNTNIDKLNTGKSFTFQDFMGLGFYTGLHRKLNAELRITHYSNGNIFTHNPGITIPLTFNIGYSFL